MHLDVNRRPGVTIHVEAKLPDNNDFGTLGVVIGKKWEEFKEKPIATITGRRSGQRRKPEIVQRECGDIWRRRRCSTCAVSPRKPTRYSAPDKTIVITQADLDEAMRSLISAESGEADFVSLGCPHLTLNEIAAHCRIARRPARHEGNSGSPPARPTKQIADRMGYTRIIETAGAKFAADTCCVVAPIKGRFKALITDSAKACYYASGQEQVQDHHQAVDEVVLAATQ